MAKLGDTTFFGASKTIYNLESLITIVISKTQFLPFTSCVLQMRKVSTNLYTSEKRTN